MVFNHVKVDAYEKSQKPNIVYENGTSHYEFEGYKIPRLSTILNWALDSEGLDAWRERVGVDVANHICQVAIKRGNLVHLIAEEYLKNNLKVGQYENELLPYSMFKALRPSLDRISDIHGIEMPVVSEKFGVGGQIDICASFDGVPAIIDIKSSRAPKRMEWCERYFLQTAFYSIAFEEMTKTPISTLVILIVSENGQVQVLKQDRDEWMFRLESIIRSYMQAHKELKN